MPKQKNEKKEGDVAKFKIVLDEPYMRIAKSLVTFPNQSTQHEWWFFLEKDVVQIVALTTDNKCVLNKQWKPGAQRYVLEFPAGHIEPTDSSLQEAAKRELLEETGYVAKRIFKLTTLFVSPTNQPTKLHVFLATALTLTKHKIQDNTIETIENILVPLQQIPGLIESNRLSCMSSIAAAYIAILAISKNNRKEKRNELRKNSCTTVNVP